MKLEINFESVEAMKSNHDFMVIFCKKVLVLLDEFQNDFKSGLEQSDVQKLSDASHKISSTMKLLNLDEFYDFVRSYKKIDFQKPDVKQNFKEKIIKYTEKLKRDLKTKIAEFS